MFTLAGKYTFAPDPELCWLWAGSGYASEEGRSLKWVLHLQSKFDLIRIKGSRERASLGIHVNPIPTHVRDWTDLSGQDAQFCQDSLHCGFQVCCGITEWEELVTIQAQFGELRGAEIEVRAEGQGCVESSSDWFETGVVEFAIHSWAKFRGVAINVPLNTKSPVKYAEAQVRTLLPRYAFRQPRLREANDETGTLRGVEVLFEPDVSRR